MTDYELEDFRKGKTLINIYDNSFITRVEYNNYWKEFAFDLISELSEKVKLCEVLPKENLLTFIKNNYIILIEKYNLNINILDYVEINDYVEYEDWIKEAK